MADKNARSAGRNAAKETSRRGADPFKAFSSTLSANHPTPGHVSPYAYAEWDMQRVAEKLEDILRKKDEKLGRVDVDSYDEVMVVIFTDEPLITQEMMIEGMANVAYRPTHIDRVFAVLGYQPSTGGCAVLTLWPT